MDETLTNVLVMRVKETYGEGKIRQLRVPDPIEGLTAATVKAVMDKIAAEELIWFSVSPYGARIIQTTTANLDITAE